eukprot:14037043-Alexandrium_andersonii.AAC.1
MARRSAEAAEAVSGRPSAASVEGAQLEDEVRAERAAAVAGAPLSLPEAEARQRGAVQHHVICHAIFLSGQS